MAFAGLNYLAVLVAAIVSYAFGALWYGLLGKQWLAALGKTREDMSSPLVPMIVSFLAQLVMAWVLAGVIGHLGEVEIGRSMISAAFIWGGFVVTTMLTNHRFQGAAWSLTFIDLGHWLGVLLLQGLVIGWFGV